MVELIYGLYVRGIIFFRKLNNFSCLIICLIWILDVVICFVVVDVCVDILFLCIIGGVISIVLCRVKRFWMLKFLLVIIIFFGFRFLRKLLVFIIFLLLIFLLYNFEIKLKCKIGDIEISNLNVFEDLYWL